MLAWIFPVGGLSARRGPLHEKRGAWLDLGVPSCALGGNDEDEDDDGGNGTPGIMLQDLGVYGLEIGGVLEWAGQGVILEELGMKERF